MKINDENITLSTVKQDDGSIRTFCLNIVKEFYGIEYHHDWAYDLDDFQEKENSYNTHQSIFLVIKKENEIIATAALRPLNSASELIEGLTDHFGDGKDVGVVTRVFIAKEYRGMGYGKMLAVRLERFAYDVGYAYLYLHATFKPDVASFWQKRGFTIFSEEKDSMQTVHMEKQIL